WESRAFPVGGGSIEREATDPPRPRACRGDIRPPCSQDRGRGPEPGIFHNARARKEMGEFQQYFDIILFGMVAAFLVLRLRSVLGRRTGTERRRAPFVRRPRPPADPSPTSAEPPPGPAAPTIAPA